MSCDVETSTITLKSTRNVKPTNVDYFGRITMCPHRNDTLVHFIIFHYPPLEFAIHLEVSKAVFGRNAVDADCSQGLLLVMYHDNTICAFSMEYIFNKVRCKESLGSWKKIYWKGISLVF